MKIDIQERSLNFAVRTVKFFNKLPKILTIEIIAKQLIRSSTSIGANLEEANAASSRKDFIHKVSIACKECRETRYWLTLLERSKLINPNNGEELAFLLKECDELVRILSTIIKNTKNNNKNTLIEN